MSVKKRELKSLVHLVGRVDTCSRTGVNGDIFPCCTQVAKAAQGFEGVERTL